jgi:biotin carboxyl carrier protein
MKLDLTINGRDGHIELVAPAPACRYQLDGAPVREANVESPVPGIYTVLVDGRSYDAFVEVAPTGLIVSIHGQRFEIDVRDPRRLTRRSAGGGGGGVQTLCSPMPGKVVRVLVAAGDTVAVGQGILVIEAMKMQNELKAARAGSVLSIGAKEGATVVAGESLATIG